MGMIKIDNFPEFGFTVFRNLGYFVTTNAQLSDQKAGKFKYSYCFFTDARNLATLEFTRG